MFWDIPEHNFDLSIEAGAAECGQTSFPRFKRFGRRKSNDIDVMLEIRAAPPNIYLPSSPHDLPLGESLNYH